jgi:hypothetical protein
VHEGPIHLRVMINGSRFAPSTNRNFNLTLYRSLSSLAFLAAIACFGQTNPAAKPAPTAKKPAPAVRAHGSANRVAPSDAQVEKDIRERFAASKIADDKFDVHVQAGRATITGKTDVLQHKGTATRMAHAAGATDVVNKVEPSEAAREKAAANLTKGRRRAQVQRSETVARSEHR